jgi:DNA polymerase-3 subunit chi
MSEVFFYHLTRQPLEVALPSLLARARQAGWKVFIRATSPDRLTWLDERLWQPEESFLPHAQEGGEFDAEQPILLGLGDTIANSADCLVSIDGADLGDGEIAAIKRAMILFDGNDGDAVTQARAQWKTLTGAGVAAQYWSQETGRWEKKAQHPPA